MSGKNEKKSWKKTVLIVLCIILALILLALIFVYAYAMHLLNLIGRYEEEDLQTLSPEQVATWTDDEEEETMAPDFTGPILEPEDVTFPIISEEEPVVQEDYIVNILLIGQDRREGQGRQRSDSMILCTFDKKNKTITMTSFLRDMYVDIPGYQASKMNAAYAWGGMPLLTETLYTNFGVQVDACVEVDFGGFQKVIDLVGGVDVNLTAKEVEYFQRRGWEFVEGQNHMTGEQALVYSRIRSLDSDFGRTQRQRNVLNSVINKCKTMSLTGLMELLNEALPMITTDMTNSEIIGYATELFPLLAGGTVQTLRIPADGMYEYAYVARQSVLLVDFEAARKLLQDTLLTP